MVWCAVYISNLHIYQHWWKLQKIKEDYKKKAHINWILSKTVLVACYYIIWVIRFAKSFHPIVIYKIISFAYSWIFMKLKTEIELWNNYPPPHTHTHLGSWGLIRLQWDTKCQNDIVLYLLALVCGVFCEFVTFPLESWVRCGTWLYRFLIFAPLLTYLAITNGCKIYVIQTGLVSNTISFWHLVSHWTNLHFMPWLDMQTVFMIIFLNINLYVLKWEKTGNKIKGEYLQNYSYRSC